MENFLNQGLKPKDKLNCSTVYLEDSKLSNEDVIKNYKQAKENNNLVQLGRWEQHIRIRNLFFNL